MSERACFSYPGQESTSLQLYISFKKLINIFLVALSLHYFTRAFSSCSKWGQLLFSWAPASCCSGFSCCRTQALVAWASVVAVRRLQSSSSVVVAQRLCCSTACGILSDQISNPCPLHCQVDSYLLYHQGSPIFLNEPRETLEPLSTIDFPQLNPGNITNLVLCNSSAVQSFQSQCPCLQF